MTETIANCLWCNQPFKRKNLSKLYCTDNHRYLADQKRKKEGTVKKKIVETKLLDLRWKKSKLGQLQKFYEIFGNDGRCNLCGMTFEESIDKFNIPLFIKLQPGINDYRVMDIKNWIHTCLDCEVTKLMKKN